VAAVERHGYAELNMTLHAPAAIIPSLSQYNITAIDAVYCKTTNSGWLDVAPQVTGGPVNLIF
jgi:hypothetical protein